MKMRGNNKEAVTPRNKNKSYPVSFKEPRDWIRRFCPNRALLRWNAAFAAREQSSQLGYAQ